MRNGLVIVSENNLYWREDVLEPAEDDLALSNDGLADSVFNGIPDWVYEEEVLGTNYAHYINELGSRIAFAKFNDSLVPEFRYPHYGDPEKVEEWQYPEYRTVRYPKAGETNPTVSLWVRCVAPLQCNDDGNKLVIPPAEVSIWGEYIYTVAEWTSDDVLSVTWMNRIQNSSCISECRENGTEWQCSPILTQEQPGGWIEIAPSPVYSSNGDFLVVQPSRQASGLTFPHVAIVGKGGVEEPRFISSG
jgi:dipeptidyl-peptidase-4